MHLARLNIILLFVMMLMPRHGLASVAIADTIPDELRWSPIIVMEASEVVEVDSLSGEPIVHADVTTKSPEELAEEEENRNWWYLFKKGKLKMDDPNVKWPKFLGFCVKVYNWGDRVFSSTDHDYVVGTGKKWRARIINDNWANSYYMKINPQFNSIMSTPLHVLVGASLQYMAVSYTYSVDMTHILTGSPISYKKQEFGFNCARFSADGYYYSSQGCNIRTFGDYKGHLREPFSGVDMTTFGLDAYYFFNGYKYSQGAAYNFSKYQKKSQGCWMAGLSYCNQNISFDFTDLPKKLEPYLKFEDLYYKFHYNDYNVLVGYGYNCVLSPHWLYNITVIPGVGFNHCYEDSEDGSAKLLSISGRAMTSFTFNSGNWFAGLQGRIRGRWYQSKRISLFNAVETITLSGGIRF